MRNIQVTSNDVSLYHVAQRELGDSSQWNRIADLNGIEDPDLTSLPTPITIKIPDAIPSQAGPVPPDNTAIGGGATYSGGGTGGANGSHLPMRGSLWFGGGDPPPVNIAGVQEYDWYVSDTHKLYTYRQGKWAYFSDVLEGVKGDKGDTGTITIKDTVTLGTGQKAYFKETSESTEENRSYEAGVPKGDQGPEGPQGPQGPQGPKGDSGIASVITGKTLSGDGTEQKPLAAAFSTDEGNNIRAGSDGALYVSAGALKWKSEVLVPGSDGKPVGTMQGGIGFSFKYQFAGSFGGGAGVYDFYNDKGGCTFLQYMPPQTPGVVNPLLQLRLGFLDVSKQAPCLSLDLFNTQEEADASNKHQQCVIVTPDFATGDYRVMSWGRMKSPEARGGTYYTYINENENPVRAVLPDEIVGTSAWGNLNVKWLVWNLPGVEGDWQVWNARPMVGMLPAVDKNGKNQTDQHWDSASAVTDPNASPIWTKLATDGDIASKIGNNGLDSSWKPIQTIGYKPGQLAIQDTSGNWVWNVLPTSPSLVSNSTRDNYTFTGNGWYFTTESHQDENAPAVVRLTFYPRAKIISLDGAIVEKGKIVDLDKNEAIEISEYAEDFAVVKWAFVISDFQDLTYTYITNLKATLSPPPTYSLRLKNLNPTETESKIAINCPYLSVYLTNIKQGKDAKGNSQVDFTVRFSPATKITSPITEMFVIGDSNFLAFDADISPVYPDDPDDPDFPEPKRSLVINGSSGVFRDETVDISPYQTVVSFGLADTISETINLAYNQPSAGLLNLTVYIRQVR